VLVCTADNVDGLLGTAGLENLLVAVSPTGPALLTPSSIGTEKKSVPVVLAIASPPATPGR
jgi:hypothetical protein